MSIYPDFNSINENTLDEFFRIFSFDHAFWTKVTDLLLAPPHLGMTQKFESIYLSALRGCIFFLVDSIVNSVMLALINKGSLRFEEMAKFNELYKLWTRIRNLNNILENVGLDVKICRDYLNICMGKR